MKAGDILHHMASAKGITIESVGMTAIVCRRSSYQRSTTRKFKAACGSVVEFRISASGAIENIDQYHDHCKRNCPACDERTRLAKLLIESGK